MNFARSTGRDGMRWGWMREFLALGLVGSALGCAVNPNAQPITQQTWYLCENGRAFAVEFLANPPSARIQIEQNQVILPQTIGATDAKYSDGHTTLYIEGERALLETGAQILGRGCVRR